MPKTYKPNLFIRLGVIAVLLFPVLKCMHAPSISLGLYMIFAGWIYWLLYRLYNRYLVCSIDLKDEGVLFVKDHQEELFVYDECYHTHTWLVCRNRRLCLLKFFPRKLLKRLKEKTPLKTLPLKNEFQEIREMRLIHPTVIATICLLAGILFFLICSS